VGKKEKEGGKEKESFSQSLSILPSRSAVSTSEEGGEYRKKIKKEQDRAGCALVT